MQLPTNNFITLLPNMMGQPRITKVLMEGSNMKDKDGGE